MRLRALRNILPVFAARRFRGQPPEIPLPVVQAEVQTVSDMIPDFENKPVVAEAVPLEQPQPEQMQPITSWTPDGETEARVSEESVIGAICTVYDPEIPVNIYELGLIYAVEIADNGNVKVEMTLTAPGCPSAQELPEMVRDAIAKIDGVGDILVDTVWDPPWDQSRMSEEARLMLNMF